MNLPALQWKIRTTLVLTAAILLIPCTLRAKNVIPDSYLKYAAAVDIGTSKASGFFLNAERQIFFVTAKHVIFKDKDTLNGEKVNVAVYTRQGGFEDQIKLELSLKKLVEMEAVRPHPAEDVILIKVADLMGADKEKSIRFIEGVKVMHMPTSPNRDIVGINYDNIKKYQDIFIANDVFIFGYPSSLGIKNFEQIDYEKPLVRKGIISGKNEKKRTIILDCQMYYGNSGGPVVEVEPVSPTANKFNVIGVVSQFVPFEEQWVNVQYHYINRDIQNSGYTVATPMDAVLELINNPTKKS